MERAVCKALRTALEGLDVSAIEQRFNVKVRIGHASFDPSPNGGATFKLEFAPVVSGEVKTKEATDFERLAYLYGLEASDLGKTFSSNGRTFTICGLAPKAHKFPILAKCADDGKTYKFPERSVLLSLGRP